MSVQSGAASASALKASTVPPAANQSDTSPLSGRPGSSSDADARRLAGERAGNVVGMLAAGVVVVGDDDHIGAGEMLGEVGLPLAGAAGVGGRGDAVAGERLDVLLALDDEHRLLERDRLDAARAGDTGLAGRL